MNTEHDKWCSQMEMKRISEILEKAFDQGYQYWRCLTCRITFNCINMYRNHYTTEYHRYNLKRKIAGLSPISEVEFQKKEETDRIKEEEKQIKKIFECTICKKKYNNENQYKNHLTSTMHKNNTKNKIPINRSVGYQRSSSNSLDSDIYLNMKYFDKNAEIMPSTEEIENMYTGEITLSSNPNDQNCCLFCSYRGETMYHVLCHMKKSHSFVIPDEEYLISHKSLLEHLSRKIWYRQQCLWCDDSGKQLRSGEAARSHMIDKGHCKMRFEGKVLKEYKSFYDYSSKNQDDNCSEEENTEETISPEDQKLLEKVVITRVPYSKYALQFDIEQEYVIIHLPDVQREEQMEMFGRAYYAAMSVVKVLEENGVISDESDKSSDLSNSLSEELPLDEESDPDALEYEMVLPSGKRIGHRSLMRYYKQHVKTEPVALKERIPRDLASKMRSIDLKVKSLGSKPETIVAAENKRMRDIQHEQGTRTKYLTQLQLKQNKLQKKCRPRTNV